MNNPTNNSTIANAALPVIDWTYGKQLNARSPGLFEELLELFMAQLPQAQEEANQYYHEQEFSELSDVLHKLHGSCAYCGVMRLKAVLIKFSVLLNQHQSPPLALLEEFNREIELIHATMRKQK